MPASFDCIQSKFEELYQEKPLIVRSPGRVNIIGEHTDYNDGFVLPAAIDKFIFIAVSKRTDERLCLYSKDFNEFFECEYNALAPSKVQWANYIMGVVDQLLINGYKLTGFNLCVDGDIPIGAGLSSSAAVECACIFALNELFSLGITRIDLVKMAQQAEHKYAGVRCGIMDQFASVFGKKDHCVLLDCRTLDYDYQPLQLGGRKLLLLNTNVTHSLASSEYNTRRQQCEQGVAWIREYFPAVKNLRDVSETMLDELVLHKDPLIYKRCRFVIQENTRVLSTCQDLKRGDIQAAGKKMFETHRGLSEEYEVSCAELDFLIHQVKNDSAVVGARMLGGGFGGCTINIVEADAIERLVSNISGLYRNEMGLELTAYVANIEDGTYVAEPKSEKYPSNS